jgi:hypothetical protein
VEGEDFFIEYVNEHLVKLNRTRNVWTQMKIALKKHNIGLYRTLGGSVLCCGHYSVIKEKNKVNLHHVNLDRATHYEWNEYVKLACIHNSIPFEASRAARLPADQKPSYEKTLDNIYNGESHSAPNFLYVEVDLEGETTYGCGSYRNNVFEDARMEALFKKEDLDALLTEKEAEEKRMKDEEDRLRAIREKRKAKQPPKKYNQPAVAEEISDEEY